MPISRLSAVGTIGLVLGVLFHSACATTAKDDVGIGDLRDRLAIEEKLLYAYAYAYDSKDCARWANLFATDGVFDASLAGGKVTGRFTGRDALLQLCTTRQKDVLANIKTRHNLTNVVFDRLTSTQAETRTYIFLTWQKTSDPAPVPQLAATYRDIIVKQDGRWVFKERRVTSD